LNAKIERIDDLGDFPDSTPLLIAITRQYNNRRGTGDVALTLLQAGADFSLAASCRGHDRNFGYNALHLAVYHNACHLVSYILQDKDRAQGVINARIVRHGVGDGEFRDYTPLLIAIKRNHVEIACQLAKAGADPSEYRRITGNNYGYNALHLAAYHALLMVIEAIIERNHPNLRRALIARIERSDGEHPRATPSRIASKRGYTEIQALIQRTIEAQAPVVAPLRREAGAPGFFEAAAPAPLTEEPAVATAAAIAEITAVATESVLSQSAQP
jgi:hypothetical protein